jgi:hypothetical protein
MKANTIISILFLALFCSNCQKDDSDQSGTTSQSTTSTTAATGTTGTTGTTSTTSTTSTTATTSTTSTTATTTPVLKDGSLLYDNILVDSMTGACEYGAEFVVVSGGMAATRSYTLYVTFPNAVPQPGIYKAVAPQGTLDSGLCAVQLLRGFNGTTQSLYAPIGSEFQLFKENGQYKVSFPVYRFVAINTSSFFANVSAQKVGCY